MDGARLPERASVRLHPSLDDQHQGAMHMSHTRLVRSILIGAASLACFTMTIPARADLPGGGGYIEWDSGPRTEYAHISLGNLPWDEWTCFLAGVSGTLWESSYATVYGSDNTWFLDVQPPTSEPGDEVAAKAVCLNTSDYSATGYSTFTNGTKTLSSTAGGTQCFLSSVFSSYSSFWFGASASISVDGSNWVLTTSGLDGDGSDGVGAICLPVPGAWTYEWNHTTGTYTIANPGGTPSWQDTESNPVACGIRGISGEFQGDASDGVDMNWPSSWGGYWNMTATNGKYGWLTCLQ
jgi:hypothetical protein